MNEIQIAAGIVGAEVAAVGKAGDPEWIAGAAMCYTHPRVRGWREKQRIEAGFGFTIWPATILASESGYCGSCVLVWRSILEQHGIKTRQIGLTWNSQIYGGPVGHVCAEAHWNKEWHFYDVMSGTHWYDNGVLSWDQIRGNENEAALRISDESAIRYAPYDPWFAVDPFAYIHVEPLEVKYVTILP